MKLKKKICVILAFSLFILTGCKNQKDNYEYYTKNFIGAFDTITTYITYATNQDDFDKQCELIDKDLNYLKIFKIISLSMIYLRTLKNFFVN